MSGLSRGPRMSVVPDYEPGPLPRERYQPDPPKFPSDRVLNLEAGAQKAWEDLVAQVRGSGDRDAWMALGRFHVAMQAFLQR